MATWRSRGRIRGWSPAASPTRANAVVSGAVVTATSANAATAATRTNADGHYLLAPLVPSR